MTDVTIEEVVAQYDAAKAQYDEARRQIADRGAEVLNLSFQKLFVEHPQLKAVQFKAYAPYFNDGEPCIWGLHGVYTGVASDDPITTTGKYGPTDECGDEDDDSGIAWFDGWVRTDDETSIDYLADEVTKRVESMEETIRDCLGEQHMQVIVTPAGMVVEDYGDHD